MVSAGHFGFQWHLTDRCDGRCRHCYQQRSDAGRELGLAGWRRLAEAVARGLAGRSWTVNLTGGEPLLLAELEPLLGHLQRLSGLAGCWIITNGLQATPERLARLSAFDKLAGFKVSVEAAVAPVHDAIRGPGHFARLARRLPAFVQTGKPVLAMTTLGRHNVDCMAETLAWARESGLAGVILERFVPLGRGRAMAGAMLDAAGWQRAMATAADCAGVALAATERRRLRALWIAFGAGGVELRGAACDLGPDGMALLPDGSVLPCRRLPLVQGNRLREPLASILPRLARWAPGRRHARLRGPAGSGCGDAACAGCRAAALAHTGDALGDDPHCPGPLAVADRGPAFG